jgi:hypothetical protein
MSCRIFGERKPMAESATMLTMRTGVPSQVLPAVARGIRMHSGGPESGVGVIRAAGEYCLVATRLIAAGERMFRIEGDLTPQPSRYSVQIGYQLHIDLNHGVPMEEILDRYFWRFMNHSCDPSTVVREREVFAAREIKPWEPVTFNYNTTEWALAEPFVCGCGSAHCLGRVQGYRFLDANQRTQLGPVAPHMARYLEETSHR